MGKEGPLDMREAAFKALAKGKQNKWNNESGHVSKEEGEVNFVKKLQQGSGTFRDADCAGSVDDRKRTSDGAFYMGSQLVSWFNKKQSLIALSTAKAEYVAVASCCTQLLWIIQTLQDIQITYTLPISILCDNTSAISISENPVMHSNTKNIPIKNHFLQEKVLQQKVKLEYVPSKEQVVDIFTKPLPREKFEYLRQKLSVDAASSYC
eukprot:PITA_20550